ncbi:MAG: hypothetical protein GY842_09325 [bacterium]|nr:hypothetical protein [bacterium]
MKSKPIKLLLTMFIVGALANVALADLLDPFSFSFFNGFLNNVFLLPFNLGGCI